MEERDLAVTLARGRIAFGVVSLLAPGLVARMMTGGDGSELPGRCSAPGWPGNSTPRHPRHHSIRANERTVNLLGALSR